MNWNLRSALPILTIAVVLLGSPTAVAGENPPALSGNFLLFETTWNDSSNVGRVVIALDPTDSSVEGKIWFPMEGTCTWGKWGTIEPGALRIDGNKQIVPTQETIQMTINGECGPTTATFEPNRNRLRAVRANKPHYTFYIKLNPG